MTADKSENFGNRVVIVGGGFGGLAAARALEEAAVEIVLIDRANHHLFQPLLYQVATAALSPGDIAWPLRTLFRSRKTFGSSSPTCGRSIGLHSALNWLTASRFPMIA